MIKTIEKIRKTNADRLISITGTKNALYYHLEKKGKINQLKIDVPDGQTVESIIPLFENAALFEAEATELYGMKFDGNPLSGKRLFQPEKEKGDVACFPGLMKKGEK